MNTRSLTVNSDLWLNDTGDIQTTVWFGVDGNDIEFPAVSLLKLLEQNLDSHQYLHDGSYDEEGILSTHKQISFLRLQLDLFEEKLKNLKISEKKG
jgi:hypothetical protein